MRPLGIFFAGVLGFLSAGAQPLEAAESVSPEFQQVYDLIKNHLPGISEKELDQAAYLGLIKQLEPKVSIIATNALETATENSGASLQIIELEGNLAYARVTKINAETAQKTGAMLTSWQATNHLAGIVLDLRYSTGDDYKAAAKIADLFLDSDKTLLKWGNETAQATPKTNSLKMPVSILVNHQTAAAAEALAAIMRQNHAGLILGGRTAGQTADFKIYPLSNGRQLRIATNLPRLDDDKELPINGITPDIDVVVNPDEERVWFNDSYAVIGKAQAEANNAKAAQTSSTNRLAHRRINEAELVRQQRENQNTSDVNSLGNTSMDEPAKLSIQDPTLARAIDLLKGLAVVRRVARRD